MRPLTKKFLLATFLALSMEVTVQASTVTMTLRNVTVKQAIVDLQKNTGYSVVIYAKDVDMNRRVSVDARNEKVANVVGQILAGQDVDYEVNGKTIVVSQHKSEPKETARTQKANDKKQKNARKGGGRDGTTHHGRIGCGQSNQHRNGNRPGW